MDPILLQKKVTENAEEMQNMVQDLLNWEKDMKRKEQSRLQEISPNQEELPPVRKKMAKNTEDLKVKVESSSSITEEKIAERQNREKSLFEKERGNELVKQGKYREAIHHYTLAIETYREDATFYANRALCFLNTKQWKEVETDCTIALQLDPNYVKAYHRRASALKELGQLSEAHDDLQKALKLEPNNVSLKADSAKIEKLLNDKAILVSKSVQSKESNKNLAYTFKEKGNAFVKKGNWLSAIENYTEACRLYPEDSSFYSNRALCYLKMNEPKKTILDCIRALELDPNNTKALYRKALAHVKLNNDSSAHDDLLAAFKLEPTNKAVQEELNKLEKKLGLNEEKDSSAGDSTSKVSSSDKRLSGERFLKLGGKFVKPVKKAPHMLSKKPLKKISISDKSEVDIVQNVLSKIPDVNEVSLNQCDTTQLPQSNSKTKSNKTEVQIDVNSLPEPKTSMQFVASWNKLLRNPSLQYQYLKKLKGEQLPAIFKEALECDVFSQILEVLATKFIEANEPVHQYLNGLSNVKRFSALLLFASEEDKENIKLLIDHCAGLKEVPDADISSLKSRFYC
ncbi:RNA polymerase II-associated protein 3-like [Planococcus citri]|uniref:RNA polymerase II-associated protein 3-like n=1 Tax=Planococcus citri TaxID=170843 RepID=UPI0031F8B8E6